MMLAYLLFCTPFIAKTTLLKSLGDILELISNYTQTHINNHGKEGSGITQYPTSDGEQTVSILRVVSIVCVELLFLS